LKQLLYYTPRPGTTVFVATSNTYQPLFYETLTLQFAPVKKC